MGGGCSEAGPSRTSLVRTTVTHGSGNPSLEPDDDLEMVQKLWADELERPARRVLAGESKGEDWGTVYQRFTTKLA